MKQAFLLLLTVVVTAVSHAANTKPIEDVFERYWSAYAKKDFAKAAADVLPSDLDELKSAVLPVFLAAQGHKEKEAQEILTAFFGRTVGKARDAMTGADVYAALNRLVMTNDPQMFEQLKDARTSIIFVRTPADDTAEVHFQVTIAGASDTDSETFTKKNGRWWLRMKDSPKDTAAQFKQIFEAKK